MDLKYDIQNMTIINSEANCLLLMYLVVNCV